MNKSIEEDRLDRMASLPKDSSFEGLKPKGLSHSRVLTPDSLAKALLANIDVKKSPLPAPIPLASSSAGTSGDVDSGYATATTTPERGTPATTHSINADANVPLRKKLFPGRATKLKPFEKPVPTLVRKRFEDLLKFVGKPLYDYIVDAGFRYTGISMKLRVLGTSEETAKPWIVVQCDKGVSKKVKQFFNQSSIKLQCAPLDDDPSFPRLEVVVLDRPPRPSAVAMEVWGQSHHDGLTSTTSCGMVIRVGEPGEARVATLGGIIKIIHPEKGSELYGMSAGHVLANMTYQEEEAAEEVQNDGDDDIEESNPEEEEEEEEYELDLEFGDDDDEDSQEPSCGRDLPTNLKNEAPHEAPWSKVGHVYMSSYDLQGDAGNLDWALIGLEDRSLYRPNLLVTSSTDPKFRFSTELTEPTSDINGAQSDRPVALLNSFSGLKNGILKQNSSYLMLAPGQSFTRTHDLKFTDGSRLSAGDSGSWVVDCRTFEVCGHVVASDVFDEAHVIPIQSTFDDMKKQLSIESVSVPTQADIVEWQAKTTESSPAKLPSPTSRRVAALSRKESTGPSAGGSSDDGSHKPGSSAETASKPRDSEGRHVLIKPGSSHSPAITQDKSKSLSSAQHNSPSSSTQDLMNRARERLKKKLKEIDKMEQKDQPIHGTSFDDLRPSPLKDPYPSAQQASPPPPAATYLPPPPAHLPLELKGSEVSKSDYSITSYHYPSHYYAPFYASAAYNFPNTHYGSVGYSFNNHPLGGSFAHPQSSYTPSSAVASYTDSGYCSMNTSPAPLPSSSFVRASAMPPDSGYSSMNSSANNSPVPSLPSSEANVADLLKPSATNKATVETKKLSVLARSWAFWSQGAKHLSDQAKRGNR